MWLRLYAILLLGYLGSGCSPGTGSPTGTSSSVPPARISTPMAQSLEPTPPPLSGTEVGSAERQSSGALSTGASSYPAGSGPAVSDSLPGTREVSSLQVPDSFPSDAVVRGKALFAVYCTPCHGEDGRGIRGATPLGEPRRFRYGARNRQVLRTILYGIPRTAMGKYTQMTPQQGLDLVAYVRSLQE
jgi:mono/diheme cytochrome c family protein